MHELLFQGIFNGLILGMLYGLIGVGLNIVFGVLRVINFAHGEFMILGAYLALMLANDLGINLLFVLPVTFLAFCALGYLLYFLLIPRLFRSDDPETSSLLLMFGTSIALSAIMLLLFEADARTLQYDLEPVFIMLGSIIIPTIRLIAFVVCLAIIALLSWFLYRTITGKALRAIIMNRDAVRIVGIKIERLSGIAFALGIGLAGAAGVFVALIFPAFSPFMGNDYTLIGFVVIVLGGLGHPIGAMSGALLFAVTEQVASVYFNPSIASIFGFLMLVGMIFARPTGLFGKQLMR